MASADESGLAKLYGVYEFEHPGGVFDVHLRPMGKFFAPKFQAAKTTWTCTEAGELSIEFAKYGQYKLEITDPATRSFAGSAIGKPESWRKVRASPIPDTCTRCGRSAQPAGVPAAVHAAARRRGAAVAGAFTARGSCG